jgi:carbamoyltransferase
MRSVLGISAFYHDSAAALVMDGKIVAAAQEERFTRVKHDEAYPRNAVDYVLTEAGLTLAQVDRVVFYDKPFLKFERLLETYVSFAPRLPLVRDRDSGVAAREAVPENHAAR